MNDIRKEEVEKAFIRMLSRVGGGFKFSSWLEFDWTESERSVLSKRADADFEICLYGSDYKNESHIVGYVGVIRIDSTLRIKAVIDYYEEVGAPVRDFMGPRHGKIVSSAFLDLPCKGPHHKGIGNSMEVLYKLIESFDKNIAQL